MGEIFSEWIVKRRTPQKVKMIQALLIVVCVFSLVIPLYIQAFGILIIAAIIFLTYLYFRNNDIEWEYSLVEKTLYVDKIMKKSKRKRVGEYDLTKSETMAPEASYHIKEYDKRNFKYIDYSSMIPENKKYALIIMHNNEMLKLILEPDDRMIKELRDIIPRQFHMD